MDLVTDADRSLVLSTWNSPPGEASGPHVPEAFVRQAAATPDQVALEVLTKALDMAVGDQADGEAEKRFMDVVALFPADPQSAEAVEPGDRALDHIAEGSQTRSVFLASSGDHRADATLPEQASVLVVVVAAIREKCVGPVSGSADDAGHGRNLVEQGQELGDVVAGSAGQGRRERDALPLDDEVVLAARPCAVDRAGPAFGPRRAARTWEESITARDQSSFPAARSFFSSTRCSSSHTPASFHAARRRQHVIPEPKPNSCGRYPTGYRCAARTGSRTAPAGPAPAACPRPASAPARAATAR